MIGLLLVASFGTYNIISTITHEKTRDIAILNQAFAPLISILDARDALLNGGPEGTGDDAVRESWLEFRRQQSDAVAALPTV